MTLPGFLLAAALCWVVFVLLPSVLPVRSWMARPLVARDPGTPADAAYLLAGGDAFRERLSAGVRCYHEGRVPLVILQRDDRPSTQHHSGERWTATQWALAYLEWRGVPAAKVRVLDPPRRRRFGTASEARNVARNLPAEVRRLLLVTSAAHTRRALLAFGRCLPRGVQAIPHPATRFPDSLERYRPLWVEYGKLLLYALLVRGE